jgi:hypothetical protein
MAQQKKRQQPQHRHRGRYTTGSVPVFVGGIESSVRIDSIANRRWTSCHGKTAGGIEVHSARFTTIGESTLIQGETGPVLSILTTEAEILAVKLVESLGYTVTAPAQA